MVKEIKIYEERMRLLTGYYDIVKGVVRLRSQQQSLETLASRLAFSLHLTHKREEDSDVLEDMARRLMHNELNKKDATIALKELVDPCNILVPMTEDGKFGFGHLRYQEYLAARELLINRSKDLVPLVEQTWWSGVFVLFAQMNESVHWLLDAVVEKMRIKQAKETMLAIINVRPSNERGDLLEMFMTHLKQDEREAILMDIIDLYDNYDDSIQQ